MEEKTFIPDYGMVGYDHCSGNALECIFKENYPYLKIWNRLGNL